MLEIHNPSNIPIEKLPKGHRFLYKSEVGFCRIRPVDILFWCNINNKWLRADLWVCIVSTTYATNLSMEEFKIRGNITDLQFKKRIIVELLIN